MIAPPSSVISISKENAGYSLATPRHCGKTMSRVVSLQINNTFSSSLSKLDPVISQSDGMSSDNVVLLPNKRGAYLPAIQHDATPPIVQSRSPLPDVAVEAQISPSPNDESKPVTVGSLDHSNPHSNMKNEACSLGFHRSQVQIVTSTYKKRSANSNISGRWTSAEHEAFLQGLKVYGREWKKVATCIPTRTSAQIRSHAQKYFAKVSREQEQLLAMTEQRRSSFPNDMSPKSDASFMNSDRPKSQYSIDTVNTIMKNPSAVETRVCQTLASLRERYTQLKIRLQQFEAQGSASHPFKSEDTNIGPATAALEQEQNSLRKAAVARYELKMREDHLRGKHQTIDTKRNSTSCARVSLASMPRSTSRSLHGGFDSSDVIALSMLGGSLGREKIENETISTVKEQIKPEFGPRTTSSHRASCEAD